MYGEYNYPISFYGASCVYMTLLCIHYRNWLAVTVYYSPLFLTISLAELHSRLLVPQGCETL